MTWAGFFLLCRRGLLRGSGWAILAGPAFVVSRRHKVLGWDGIGYKMELISSWMELLGWRDRNFCSRFSSKYCIVVVLVTKSHISAWETAFWGLMRYNNVDGSSGTLYFFISEVAVSTILWLQVECPVVRKCQAFQVRSTPRVFYLSPNWIGSPFA